MARPAQLRAAGGSTSSRSDSRRVIRTDPIRHDSDKAHGAFPNPNEKANRINAAS